MAPEQLLGLPTDGRCDLWAAGVILYELLTGCGPFVAETPVTVMHKVLHVDPAAPSSIVASLPPAFDASSRAHWRKSRTSATRARATSLAPW
ncbi:hypothetical protein [Candidatus Accumulibacter meliphilus]|uniref:hypothetical protein n=1 Tax=Candidatus Accumulibacter meliphilus TaxID=2211374 RepID=UPI003DA7CD82